MVDVTRCGGDVLQTVLAYHLVSIVVTPWILLVRLPSHSRAIVAFFANGTITNPVIGDIYCRADYRAAAEHGEVSRAMCGVGFCMQISH